MKRFLAGLFLVGWMALPAWSSPKGPVVQLAEESDGSDEEGLQRLGHFGKFSLFGYGEMHYNNRIGAGGNEIDFHRMVLGLGYDFNDWITFRMELDFEHAFTEPELEFAHLDFRRSNALIFRAGSILVPMGVINEHHEPPLFYSVERPEVYRVIIPTTWQEGGAGIHGSFPSGLHYQLYGLSSLDATGFTGSNGFRGGRGHVGEAPGRDFAGAGRLEYTGLPGLRLGASAFAGNTGQGNGNIDGGFLTMVEGDAKWSLEGIDLDGILVFTNLSDAEKLNDLFRAQDASFTNFVGRQMLGWYLEAGYHLFHHLLPDTNHDLVLFGRYEDFNTQHKMPAGFAGSAANDRNTITTGVSYLPIPQVAIKADYMFNWNQANAGVDQFNLGVGFYY